MKILDCEQGSVEWFEAHVGLPSTSDFKKIITPKTGALSAMADAYVAEKICETVDGIEERYSSYWMDRGRLLEAEACNWYELETGQDTERVGFIISKGAGWSPDRLVGAEGAIEVKCPKPSTHVKWLMAGGLPNEHRPQVHGGLWVGDKEWIDFISYCPGYKPLVVRVVPDDYTEKVGVAVQQFLERYEKARQMVLTA